MSWSGHSHLDWPGSYWHFAFARPTPQGGVSDEGRYDCPSWGVAHPGARSTVPGLPDCVGAQSCQANLPLILNTFTLLECIRASAAVTKVESPEEAETIWRLASGLAHGRRWAWDSASQFTPAGQISTGERMMRGSIDLRRIGRVTILITSTLQLADWYFAKRAGHKPPEPMEDQAFFRSGYLSEGWPNIPGVPELPVRGPAGLRPLS